MSLDLAGVLFDINTLVILKERLMKSISGQVEILRSLQIVGQGCGINNRLYSTDEILLPDTRQFD